LQKKEVTKTEKHRLSKLSALNSQFLIPGQNSKAAKNAFPAEKEKKAKKELRRVWPTTIVFSFSPCPIFFRREAGKRAG